MLVGLVVHPDTHEICEDGSPDPSDRVVTYTDGSPQVVSKLGTIGEIRIDRPEGPQVNRPERKLGIWIGKKMSAEGAAQIQNMKEFSIIHTLKVPRLRRSF